MDAVERRQQILELLCQRRKDTMQNLAAELGVSERTIRRDVEILTRSYPLGSVSRFIYGSFLCCSPLRFQSKQICKKHVATTGTADGDHHLLAGIG